MDEKEKVKPMKSTIQSLENQSDLKAVTENPEHRSFHKNLSNLDIKPVYTPDDIEDLEYVNGYRVSREFPFVRGVHPTMYRGSSGRCVSSRGLAAQKKRTNGTITCSIMGRPG